LFIVFSKRLKTWGKALDLLNKEARNTGKEKPE